MCPDLLVHGRVWPCVPGALWGSWALIVLSEVSSGAFALRNSQSPPALIATARESILGPLQTCVSWPG